MLSSLPVHINIISTEGVSSRCSARSGMWRILGQSEAKTFTEQQHGQLTTTS
jgi:hypothetical protein